MKTTYPVARLMDVARLLESRSDAALRDMFRVAGAKHLPKYWRDGVERLAKQIQEGRGLEVQALLAARRGEWKDARELIRAATDSVKSTRTKLRVTFAKPTRGSMDLGAWVLKEARRSVRRSAEKIEARRF